jgi:hypothetical protein
MRNVDSVQFVRLLDEINAVGLSDEQISAVSASMNVKPDDVKDVLNRATKKWDDLKPLLAKSTPLTEEQISEDVEVNGHVEAIIKVDFDELIGCMDDNALDGLFDDMSEQATGNICGLQDITHEVLFSDGDTLYLKVSGAVDLEEEDEEDDAETN